MLVRSGIDSSCAGRVRPGAGTHAGEPFFERRLSFRFDSQGKASGKTRNISEPNAAQVQQIIQAFAAKEMLFKQARDNYTYHQINKVQEVGPDGEVTGQFQQDWDILYDDNGTRIERVTYAPLDNLKSLILTQQDYDAFRSIQPFVMTTAELPEYDVQYKGSRPGGRGDGVCFLAQAEGD